MIPADVTDPRSTPPSAGVCSECSQRDESCDCGAAVDGVAVVIITLACIGALTIIVALGLAVVSIVRWL